MSRVAPGKCPVCSARFRGAAVCSRCGTDLTLLLRTVARAYVARERSREALQRGDLHAALRWAGKEAALVGRAE